MTYLKHNLKACWKIKACDSTHYSYKIKQKVHENCRQNELYPGRPQRENNTRVKTQENDRLLNIHFLFFQQQL